MAKIVEAIYEKLRIIIRVFFDPNVVSTTLPEQARKAAELLERVESDEIY